MKYSGKNIINDVLEYLSLNAKEFSERIGLDRPQAIYDILNGKTNSITRRMSEKIISVFPQINSVWLLTGEGEMLKPDYVSHSLLEETIHPELHDNKKVQQKEPEYKHSGTIKYYDIEASAGNIEMFDPANGGVHKELIVPGFSDCDFSLNIWGDSMYPVLCNGSIILCKEWKQDFIEYGAIYLVITKENHRMIKYLHPGSSDEYLTCLSENKLFNAFEIKKDDILKLYLVKGHIERNAI